MSDVKRYDPCSDAQEIYDLAGLVVAESDYDAAQSELAALREELHNIKTDLEGGDWKTEAIRRYGLIKEVADKRDSLQQRLTVAEQRNATLTTLLREGLEEYKNGDDWIERVIEALRNKPTESGARE